jgi:ABC-2 type transport system permease protein
LNRFLLSFFWRRGRTGILLVALGLFLFECVLCGLFAKTSPIRTQMLELIPAPMRAFLGSDYLSIATQAGFLAMGFAHPLALLLLGTLAILTSTRLAGDIESRTLDLILSQPVGRANLVLTHLMLGILVALLAGVAGFFGHRLGVALFPLSEPVAIKPFLLVAVNLSLFLLGMHGLGLFCASVSSRRGVAVGIAVGVLAVMLFLRLASELWDAFRIPAKASFFTYYVPGRTVAQGSLDLGDALALLGSAILSYAAALFFFARRDLS